MSDVNADGAVTDGAATDGVATGGAGPGATAGDGGVRDAAAAADTAAWSAADGDLAVTAGPDELAFDVEELPGGLLAALEAVLFVADEPVSVVRLASALGLPTDQIEAGIETLVAEYSGADGGRPRGFELRQASDGWRLYTVPAMADLVGRFVLDGQSARLSQAALETLAVIAYRQPVTRGQVAGVRGVAVDSVVRTLVARGLIAEVGTEPSSGALLYGTTGYFLERMGLNSLDDLPALAPYLPAIDTLDDHGDHT